MSPRRRRRPTKNGCSACSSRLGEPGVHVVYVTSNPVPDAIVDYYLNLLPAGIREDARQRLTMISAEDPSIRPLSAKLLERPTLLTRIRWAIPDHEDASLVPYVCTDLEYALGKELGLPVHGADPALAHLGTKSGGRELFARAGVAHPLGIENVYTRADVIAAIIRLRAVRPRIGQVVVKLDDGVSGEGNAIVELRGLPRPGAKAERARIAERVDNMRLQAPGVSLQDYLDRLERGGVVEERIVARELRSPSVQLELGPREAKVVSTHDQILTDDMCVGCRFPAESSYAGLITEAAERIGQHLVDAGAHGRAAIDFIVARNRSGTWSAYAIEINLRKGATTHPLTALELLSGGAYDSTHGTFALGLEERHYVATDHLESPRLTALGKGALFELEALPGLDEDGCGVVFHMISALDELGRMGMTVIGRSATDAQLRYDTITAQLLAAADELDAEFAVA